MLCFCTRATIEYTHTFLITFSEQIFLIASSTKKHLAMVIPLPVYKQGEQAIQELKYIRYRLCFDTVTFICC